MIVSWNVPEQLSNERCKNHEPGVGLSKKTEQLEKELQSLKGEISQLMGRKEATFSESNMPSLIKYMIDEREKTNKILIEITAKMERMEKEIDELYDEDDASEYPEIMNNRELPLSDLDAKILNFVQARGMVCADDLMKSMNYKGRNAACSRLKKLELQGLLVRHQLGHKVYYKFDAGKATNTLIISPPQ